MLFVDEENILIPEDLSETKQGLKPIITCNFTEEIPQNKTFNVHQPLKNFLFQKRLPLHQLPFSIQVIHEHYLNGYIRYQKGLTNENGRYQCERCGNNEQHLFASFPCARCRQECTYCRKCLNMERISACTLLASWVAQAEQNNRYEIMCNSPITLSSGQQAASEQLVESIKQSNNLLIWAVCGSGKTEVLFAGIEYALNRGLTVCIATPRTDVVLELTPRMKQAFPDADIVSLYGGSEDRERSSHFVISTTHQLLRYYNTFDVMIIDEVDAFPYSVEPMLRYAMEQSRRQKSSTIYLTATPDQTFLKNTAMDIATIPARYHRHALPIPTFKWCGNWKKELHKHRIPKILLRWLQVRHSRNKQVFLFVPQIHVLETVVEILASIGLRVAGVHAEDPARKEKVEAFRSNEISILVTTTILERGVTVPKVDVAVVGAEDRIFTESAFVQIAGRAGRSAAYPTGDVTFFHYGKTNAMVKAKRQIERMNREAKGEGLID